MKAMYTRDRFPKLLSFTHYNDEEIERIYGGDFYNSLSDEMKQKYPKTQIIEVEMDVLPNNPIFDGDKVRARSRKEEFEYLGTGKFLLMDGEYIEDNQLKSIPKPSEHHYWNIESKTWDFEIEKVKASYRENFKRELHSKVYSSIEFEGNHYQMGESDASNFKEVLDGIEIYVLNKKFETLASGSDDIVSTEVMVLKGIAKMEISWRLLDNSVVKKTVPELIKVYEAWLNRKQFLNVVYNLINNKLIEAEDFNSIKSISWEECKLEVTKMLQNS